MKVPFVPARVRWQGIVKAIQCRAWIWRYKTDNRTHYPLGFNLWIEGDVAGQPQAFILAISDTQHQKLQFRIGDVVKGTGWLTGDAKHEIADIYRAGELKVLSRPNPQPACVTPPFANVPPSIEVFKERGARMLDQRRWRIECVTCMWANKSAIEIEFNFGKTKRYRTETFCYGPKSCPLYDRGKERPVPYYSDRFHSMDDGGLDDCCTSHRGEDE